MNRRDFLSLMTGAAGAALVPWRGLSQPRIFLPSRKMDLSQYFTSKDAWFLLTDGRFSNSLRPGHELTQASLEGLLEQLNNFTKLASTRPTRLIVSPHVKHLIYTDSVVRYAAELALGRKL